MSNDLTTRTTPARAFGGLAMGIAVYSVFGFFTGPLDPVWRWAILFFGTGFIWGGIVELLRLGGGWIAWGVVALLTLGLGSAAAVVLNLLAAFK
ncbi:MAG: hypothetical protein LT103_01435 [Burkholderiaceae bacterium]|nr:hypothetical protein [Burkholderiaceae bacterium]